MSDEWKRSGKAGRPASLENIAAALGVPISCFLDASRGAPPVEYHAPLDNDPMLALVKAYLQAATPEARRHFVEAVRTIADELSR